jgi:uncharacterized protein (DUF952 family)
MSRILHAALPADWAAARIAGHYAVSTRGSSLAEVGFIHASTQSQLPGVLEFAYTDLDDLVLLVLDVEELGAAGSPVRWDDVPGAPKPFPHIYGPVPTTIVGQGNPVIAVLPIGRSQESGWRLPDLAAYDLATGP